MGGESGLSFGCAAKSFQTCRLARKMAELSLEPKGIGYNVRKNSNGGGSQLCRSRK